VSVECRSGLVELIADVIGLVDVRLARPCRPHTLERVHAQLHASDSTGKAPTSRNDSTDRTVRLDTALNTALIKIYYSLAWKLVGVNRRCSD